MRQSRFQYIKAFVKLGISDHERDENPHDIAVGSGSDGDQSVLVAVLRKLFGFLAGRLARRRIFDEFNGTHAAKAANFADDLELLHPILAAFFELPSKMRGAGK